MNTQAKSSEKLDRVAARVPAELKQKWMRAAHLRGQTLTDFIVVATNAAAAQTFSNHEKIELSERAQIKLAEMLLNPPALTDAMKKALAERLSEMKVV